MQTLEARQAQLHRDKAIELEMEGHLDEATVEWTQAEIWEEAAARFEKLHKRFQAGWHIAYGSN